MELPHHGQLIEMQKVQNFKFKCCFNNLPLTEKSVQILVFFSGKILL